MRLFFCRVRVSVGKVTLPMKSHKDSFVDPGAPRRLVLSVSRCSTSKTSSRALPSLRMTSLGGDCILYFAFSGRTQEITVNCLLRQERVFGYKAES